jgi:hypothetical protein
MRRAGGDALNVFGEYRMVNYLQPRAVKVFFDWRGPI